MSENTIRWALETYTKPVFLALVTANIILTFGRAKLWIFLLLLFCVLLLLLLNHKYIPEKQLPKEYLYKVFQFYVVGWTASLFLAMIFTINKYSNTSGIGFLILPFFAIGGVYIVLSTSQAKLIYFQLVSKICNPDSTVEEDHSNTKDVMIARNIVDKKPVYLLEKDRHVHLLAIGSTGSGETSQGLLPMGLQDI